MNLNKPILLTVATVFLCQSLFAATLVPRQVLPEGTRVYIVLKQALVGKKKQLEVGQIVQAAVWKDVIVRGNVLVKVGTPVLVKVETIKTAKIAGVKGQVSLGAYETEAVDGKTVQLVGGYLKEGKSRMAVSITLGVLFIIPIFITGDAARLPEGMVFDAFTGPDMEVQLVSSGEEASVPIIDLSSAISGISAEVDLEDYLAQTKPKYFRIKIEVEDHSPKKFVIDRINEKGVDPINLDVTERKMLGGTLHVSSRVKIKKLVKQFTKGINRFDVAFHEGDERISTEVILNLQF